METNPPESPTGAVPVIVTSPFPWKAAYGEFWSIEPLKNPLRNSLLAMTKGG